MVDISQVIKTVNCVISKNADVHYTGLTLNNQNKPQYNNGIRAPKICGMNLTACKNFYNEFAKGNSTQKNCPFGFTVSKRLFESKTSYKNITLFSIINFHLDADSLVLLENLPRQLKQNKSNVEQELLSLKLDESEQIQNKNFIEGLMETLLIGRIGIAIQTLSHQFFTPLQGAMSDVRNIETNIDTEASTKRLLKNFDTLNKLATEVQLLLSTSEEFNKNMLRKVVVHHIIEDIFQSLQAAADEKHIILTQEFNSHGKAVEAIPGQFHIVLSNIIHNAVKYSFTGFHDRPLVVNVSYKSDEKDLIIVVKNEGCKITEAEIKERLIFSLGYRGKFSKDRQRLGTGTGLFIANQITESHGGSIQVTSRKIGGNHETFTDRYENVFSIYWPYYYD